jgi:hypothetical protein
MRSNGVHTTLLETYVPPWVNDLSNSGTYENQHGNLSKVLLWHESAHGYQTPKPTLK